MSLEIKQNNSAIDRKPKQIGEWDPMNKNLEFGIQTSLQQEQHVKVNINPADRTTVFLKEHQLFFNG